MWALLVNTVVMYVMYSTAHTPTEMKNEFTHHPYIMIDIRKYQGQWNIPRNNVITITTITVLHATHTQHISIPDTIAIVKYILNNCHPPFDSLSP